MPVVFLLIPLLAWAALPRPYWPLLAVASFILLMTIVTWWVRKELRRYADTVAISPPSAEYRWHKGWSSTDFERHFSLFLRGRGWRILSAAPVGADRLAVVIDKQKFRLSLLCVQPGHPATADDETRLEATRSDHRVTDIVLVTQNRPTAEERNSAITRNVWLLSFEDLDSLDEAIAVEF